MIETRTTCPYCGVGCGVIVESDGEQITGVRGDPDHPANFGRLCTKGSTLHLSAQPMVHAQTRAAAPELRLDRGFPRRRVDWDTALALTANAIVTTIEEHGNEAIFSSSYGGWANAGSFRPNVLQQRFFNLIGGCSITQGDFSAGASQVALPHIIGDMEVYSPQTAWEVVRDNTEVFVLVGCDPIKNNRIEYTVADHGMYGP